MDAQKLAGEVKYSGDAVMYIMLNTLTECNFHAEVKVLHKVWEAMMTVEGTEEKVFAAARKALEA
jgi:hypothetical protein